MNAAADAPAPTFHCQAQPGKKLGDGEADTVGQLIIDQIIKGPFLNMVSCSESVGSKR